MAQGITVGALLSPANLLAPPHPVPRRRQLREGPELSEPELAHSFPLNFILLVPRFSVT